MTSVSSSRSCEGEGIQEQKVVRAIDDASAALADGEDVGVERALCLCLCLSRDRMLSLVRRSGNSHLISVRVHYSRRARADAHYLSEVAAGVIRSRRHSNCSRGGTRSGMDHLDKRIATHNALPLIHLCNNCEVNHGRNNDSVYDSLLLQ